MEKSAFYDDDNIKIDKFSLYKIAKRGFDLVVSTLLVVALIPIFLIIGIAIKVESKGPIIFKQKRIGKENKLFYIYKFRSMRVGTPTLSTEQFKHSTHYITKVGKFIRKTSLDELPQLINIIKGEMSIVGPRPVIEKETELTKLRKQYNVDTMLPGVTGWAQINGRDNIDNKTKAKYDYEYLKKQSLLFDIKIIFITFIKILKQENIK